MPTHNPQERLRQHMLDTLRPAARNVSPGQTVNNVLLPGQERLAEFMRSSGGQLQPDPLLGVEPQGGLFSEFATGLKFGTGRIGPTLKATGGAIAKIFGGDDISQAMLEGAMQREEELFQRYPRNVGFNEAFESVGNFARFAARTLGEQIPNVLSIIAGGGVGGVVGRLVGRGALTAAQGGVGMSRFGIAVGGIGAATTLETGATTQELFEATGDVKPLESFVAGIAKGALEAVVPLAFARRFGLGENIGRGIIDRTLKVIDKVPARLGKIGVGMGAGSVIEGATETLQEAIDIATRGYVDENYDMLGPEARARILEAGVTGAIVGFMFGGVGGALGRGGREETPLPPLEKPPLLLPPPALVTPPPGATPSTTGLAPVATPVIEEPPDIPPPAGPPVDVASIAPGVTGVNLPDDVVEAFGLVAQQQRFNVPLMRRVQSIAGSRVLSVVVEHADDLLHRMTNMAKYGGAGVHSVLQKTGSLIRSLRSVSGFEKEMAENIAATALKKGTTARDQAIEVDDALAVFAVAHDQLPVYNEVQWLAREIAIAVGAADFRAALLLAAELNIKAKSSGFSEQAFRFERDAAGRLIEFDASQRDRLEQEVGRKRIPTSESTVFGDNISRLVNAKKDITVADLDKEVADSNGILAYLPDVTVADKRKMIKVIKLIKVTGLAGAKFDLFKLGLIARIPDRRMGEEVFGYQTASDETALKNAELNVRVSGEQYTAENHKPGTVVTISSTPESFSDAFSTKLEKLRSVTEDMLKLFGMKNERLTIAVEGAYVTRPDGSVEHVGIGAAYGSAFTHSPNSSTIIVSGPYVKNVDDVTLATLIAHEFGHILAIKLFSQAPLGVRLQVIAGYDKSLRKAELSAKDAAANLAAPAHIMPILGNGEIDIEGRLMGNPAARSEYFLSFAEYMAEQVARWFTTSARPMGVVEKTFKGISLKLKKLFAAIAEKFGIKEQQLFADEAMQSWLDNLSSGKYTVDPAAHDLMLRAGMAETQEENAKYLGDAATPEGEMSLSLDWLMKKSGVPNEKRKEVKAGVDRMNWLLKWGYTLRQLMLHNKHIAGLRLYTELADAWNNASTVVKARAEATLKQWANLGVKPNKALDRFLFELDKMSYLGNDEPPRMPTNAELHAIAKKTGMTFESMQVYELVRSDLTSFLDKVEEVAIRDIRESVDSETVANQEIADLQKEFRAMRDRPYFPHTRFGEFSVIVKGEDGKTAYMEQFGTRTEANYARPIIAKHFGEGFTSRISKIPKEAKPFMGLPPTLLARLKKLPGMTDLQKIWIDQLSIDLSATKSFRKRFARRENIEGYSLDARRSYADYFWHGSNYLARVEYARPLQEAVDLVEAESKDPAFIETQPNFDVSKHDEIRDFMQHHLNEILNPSPDWAQARSFAFVWWLGLSVKASFVNLTQVPMVTLPYLSARYGDVKSMNAIRKAIGAIPRMMRMKTENVSDEFLKALTRGVEQGVLDESYAAMLAATAEGPNLTGLLPGNKVMRGMVKFNNVMAFLFQQSEKMNRRASFMAAWELAQADPNNKFLQEMKELNSLEYAALLKKGFSEQTALSYLAARDAVWSTQFQYSRHARARFMQGRKGIILTFYSFVQNMMFFAMHDRGRVRFLLMMFAMAGLMGLPGAEDMRAIVRFISRKVFKEDIDFEKIARKFVVDLADGTIPPDLVLHGVSRYGFGMPAAADLVGIPLPKFDVSASLGMGRIIPGLAEIGPPGSSNYDARFANITTTAAGATFGIGLNLMKFFSDDQLPWNDGKRFERALPRALRDLTRGVRYLEEGRERTRSGATLVEFDASDPIQLAETIMQMAGFAPTRLTQVWDRQRMEQEAIAFWTTRRGMLLRQFDQAVQSGDASVVRDVVASVARYNNEVAIPGFHIKASELRQSQRERARRRALIEVGLPQQRRHIPLIQGIRKLHPEVTVENAPQ